MKKILSFLLILMCVVPTCVGCSTPMLTLPAGQGDGTDDTSDTLAWIEGNMVPGGDMVPPGSFTPGGDMPARPGMPGSPTGPADSSEIAGNDDTSAAGDSLEDSGIFDGYFEEETAGIQITCVSGTEGAYTLADNVLTFSGIAADSVYAVTGQLNGSIVIDVAVDYRFELQLSGFSLVSNDQNPITALNGNKVTVTAKKDTENYIYDKREAVDPTDTTTKSGAIHSEVDLQIGGKGSLSLVSDHNNGIHAKDDLEVKNLTLAVACVDNALKGNDSVTVTYGNLTLIATQGDGIKTTASDISAKGNQRGTVTLTDTTVAI